MCMLLLVSVAPVAGGGLPSGALVRDVQLALVHLPLHDRLQSVAYSIIEHGEVVAEFI